MNNTIILAEAYQFDEQFFSQDTVDSAQVFGGLLALVWLFYLIFKGMGMGRGGGNVMQSSGLTGGKIAIVALAIIIFMDLNNAIVIVNKILEILDSAGSTLKDKFLNK